MVNLLREIFAFFRHTYEAAPVLCVVEKQMIKEMGRLVAYGDNIDGIFMPGIYM